MHSEDKEGNRESENIHCVRLALRIVEMSAAGQVLVSTITLKAFQRKVDEIQAEPPPRTYCDVCKRWYLMLSKNSEASTNKRTIRLISPMHT